MKSVLLAVIFAAVACGGTATTSTPTATPMSTLPITSTPTPTPQFEVGDHHGFVIIEDPLATHHWMALYALESDNVPETEHHVRHILELVTDAEHKARMEDVLEHLEAGEFHDAGHAIEEMLTGKAAPDLSMENVHLELTLAAFGAKDVEDAQHHLEHFIDLATGHEKEQAEEAMELLEQDNIPDAEHEVEEILGQ